MKILKLTKDNKIKTIKIYRTLTSASLREAKKYIDSLYYGRSDWR